MNIKHTPGKWTVRTWTVNKEVVYIDDTEGYHIDSPEAGHEAIITVWGIDEMSEANAKLIAAAPDLLEALKNVMPILEYAQGKTHYWPEILQCKEAIKKVTS